MNSFLSSSRLLFRAGLLLLAGLFPAALAQAAAPAVVLNEIHYHPVELPAFDSNGVPLLDLSSDVHEFVELHNPGTTNVSLAGWRLAGDAGFAFPTNATLQAGGYVVVARDPARLLAVSAYGLAASNVFGPYDGTLGNRSGTVRLRDALGETVDSVSYSSQFPWAIGADALGAEDEWTGLVSSNFQYRGRSLERVSAGWVANDPANWLASPAPGNPTPGRANTVVRLLPKPVLTELSAAQDSDGARIIRSNQAVRINCTFSDSFTNGLSSVSVEYFIDDLNVTNEARFTAAMTATGSPADGTYTALLAGRPVRSLVRYRIRANRGSGVETVSPRADDPFAWHSYFVTPVRNSTNRVYDCFISTPSLATLQANIVEGNPSELRRVVAPDPPGLIRESWNATEPAVLVYDGEVYEARARYHGSQYRRAAANNSWKWQFPRYKRLDNRSGFFISDNTEESVVCHALHRLAGMPSSYTRWIDFHLNDGVPVRRMDQDEMDDDLTDKFFAEVAAANPGTKTESSGEFYKSQGVFLFQEPVGPFGYGGYRLLPPLPPYWTALQRYQETFGLQMNGWKGHRPLIDMLEGMWAARGDSPGAVNPNTNALRAFLEQNFDVDATLTYMAVRCWTGGWDEFNHNHFAWRRANGKWAGLAWDFDGELGDLGQTNATIYLGEYGAPLIYTDFGIPPIWVDANWIKDSFYKAFRNEYRRKLFILNHTLLNPTNITALGFGSYRDWANGRFASINSQLAMGAFTRPARPTNAAPEPFRAALPPAELRSSLYSHSANPRPAHFSTTWFIRSASGNYTNPVFKLTSTSNLTNLPIPFDQLTFGQTYFWKCLYTDTNGTPSLDSVETSFVYGADPTVVPLLTLDATTLWRYNAGGTNQPATWRNLGFDDSAWPQGAPLFADGPGPFPEPVRTALVRSNRFTFYFRKEFVFAGNPSNAVLRLQEVVDDGVAVHLNGVEIQRLGINPTAILGNATLANRNVTNIVYEGPFTIVPTNLVAGTNILAVEVHRNSSSSPGVAFGLVLETLAPPQPGSVILNEILADNRGAATNGFTSPDFIELFNTTALTQNLNGFSLSDNLDTPGKYVFPPGTSIPPFGFLTVWCDDATNAPGLHTGFALDNDGQTVAIFSATPGGYVLSDSLQFGLQAADFSVARLPDGSGPWGLAAPTPGEMNQAEVSGAAADLRINEWMATDAGGPDWFELYNPGALPVALGGLWLSDNLNARSNTVIAPLSFIAPGGHRQFFADDLASPGPRHVNFKLSGGGDAVGLFQTNGAILDYISFGPQVSGVSEGRLPDGSATIRAFPGTASPEAPNHVPLPGLVINEVLAHSEPPLQDAIEIYNSGTGSLDLGGWWLSDDQFAPRKFQLPPGSVIPAGGYLTFYENQFNPAPGSAGSFGLNSARGDEVYLSAADALGNLKGQRASAKFGPSENGVTHGRFATSLGTEFVALAAPSFNAANTYAKVGPVVISEIHYHPAPLPDGSDNDRDEFIELRNLSSGPVPLFDPAAPTNRWRLRDAVDFTFPPGVTLAGGEMVLVVGFDPVANTNALAGFRDTHGTLSVRLFGPWSGKLDNSAESVELVKPDPAVPEPGPDFGYVPSILVDRVQYTDGFPWPDTADGSGFSLMRRLASGYGNDPTNWFAWAPTAGATNAYNALPSVSLLTPAVGARVLGPATLTLSALAGDADGSIAVVDYFDGTNQIGSATVPPYAVSWLVSEFGPHRLTARARDNRNATSLSEPVELFVHSQPPTVAILTPAPDSRVRQGDVITFTATANDPDTPVARVDYLIDGVWVAGSEARPYAADWTSSGGDLRLTAVATDTTGIMATSAPVRLYAQTVIAARNVLIPSNSVWRYYDRGADQGTAWTNLNFADNTWSNGVAELGYGDAVEGRPEATVVSYGPNASSKYITTYFRQKFVLTNLAGISEGVLRVLRDDGARAFLNGVEVFRNNLPAGTITFNTTAPLGIAGTDEAIFHATNVAGGLFRLGTNILAIEIHQQTTNSSDLSFDAEISVATALFGPAIIVAPVPRLAVAGENVTFSVQAEGSGPLGYQWLRNGVALNGQTATNLILNNVQPTDAGAYTVLVSNSVATTLSRPALLAVGDSDSDGDGLPDSWELAHGLDPFDALDGFLDADGDRASNLNEFRAGTDPADARSVLKIETLTVTDRAVLSFGAVTGKTYIIQFTDTLGSGQWSNLITIPPLAVPGVYSVTNPGAVPVRVYRLAVP